MTTPEPKATPQTPAAASSSWRDMVQSGADCAHIEGFALEYLIDFQRQRDGAAGEGR